MLTLNEQQIDYIISNIRARGVEMESLQENLVDHVCCIIETRLEESGNFEQLYASVIQTFYNKELKEIEAETKILLKNKNYYAMKKVMIISGIISASLLTIGILFKYLHLAGAGMLLTTGIASFSLLFLPLMFTLKMKEKEKTKDKILLGLGSLVTILISMAILFKIMHWPGANFMGIASVAILILLYLPINLVTGIRNADTKVNTIVSSILLVAGCGLFLSLARSPQSSHVRYVKQTEKYMQLDHIQNTEKLLFEKDANAKQSLSVKGAEIINSAEEIKSILLEKETGFKIIGIDFENKNAFIGDTYVNAYYDNENSATYVKINQLITLVNDYSIQNPDLKGFQLIKNINWSNDLVTEVLNDLVQLQLMVWQHERLRFPHS